MSHPDLIDRLTTLPHLGEVPREELAWLVEHGTLESHEGGYVVSTKGQRIDRLWLIISGHIAIRVDSGAGPKLVAEWHPGDVTGILPYSRMTSPPGTSYCVEPTEALVIHQSLHPEMIHRCPVFTAYTVHTMLDRARNFNTSALLDEKMVSLGRLAAGLAHELNNPASATKRAARLLVSDLDQLNAAALALSAPSLSHEGLAALESARALCLARRDDGGSSPMDHADREDRIADWLARHKADPIHAAPLADTAITVDALDAVARVASGDTLDAALRWLSAQSSTHSLATDIAQAATRIYELVAAVKKFTFMDHLAAPESVELEAGIRDTIRVLDAKVTSKSAVVTLAIEADLPPVRASGGELNQVWFNLIDNALDAIPDSGHIDITARREFDRIQVRVTDDGPGIPADVLPRIFDPFFTTKPPGHGTGLGLDMTRRLVRRFHGDIVVESRPGRTEFRVSLLADKGDPEADTSVMESGGSADAALT